MANFPLLERLERVLLAVKHLGGAGVGKVFTVARGLPQNRASGRQVPIQHRDAAVRRDGLLRAVNHVAVNFMRLLGIQVFPKRSACNG